jgi:hypothetical protein
MLTLLTSFALLMGLLVLAGCGGGQTGLVSSAVKSTGTITAKIAWPTGSTRMLPAAAYSMTMEVTGPGIGEPITASIIRPDTMLSAAVPVGVSRHVAITTFDEGGTAIAHGFVQNITVAANQTTSITLTMLGMEDYNGSDTPFTIDLDTTTGVGSVIGIIDSRPSSDDRDGTSDVFVFNAKEGVGYTITIEHLETGLTPSSPNCRIESRFAWNHPYDGWSNWEDITTVSGAWNSETGLFDNTTTVLTSPYTGQLRIHMFFGRTYYWDTGLHAATRYKVTITEGGEGGIDATVQ